LTASGARLFVNVNTKLSQIQKGAFFATPMLSAKPTQLLELLVALKKGL